VDWSRSLPVELITEVRLLLSPVRPLNWPFFPPFLPVPSQILTYLGPASLHSLSLINKSLRSLLANDSAASLWRRSLDIEELPQLDGEDVSPFKLCALICNATCQVRRVLVPFSTNRCLPRLPRTSVLRHRKSRGGRPFPPPPPLHALSQAQVGFFTFPLSVSLASPSTRRCFEETDFDIPLRLCLSPFSTTLFYRYSLVSVADVGPKGKYRDFHPATVACTVTTNRALFSSLSLEPSDSFSCRPQVRLTTLTSDAQVTTFTTVTFNRRTKSSKRFKPKTTLPPPTPNTVSRRADRTRKSSPSISRRPVASNAAGGIRRTERSRFRGSRRRWTSSGVREWRSLSLKGGRWLRRGSRCVSLLFPSSELFGFVFFRRWIRFLCIFPFSLPCFSVVVSSLSSTSSAGKLDLEGSSSAHYGEGRRRSRSEDGLEQARLPSSSGVSTLPPIPYPHPSNFLLRSIEERVIDAGVFGRGYFNKADWKNSSLLKSEVVLSDQGQSAFLPSPSLPPADSYAPLPGWLEIKTSIHQLLARIAANAIHSRMKKKDNDYSDDEYGRPTSKKPKGTSAAGASSFPPFPFPFLPPELIPFSL